MRVDAGDLEPAGVGTDVDGGEGGHDFFGCAPKRRNRPIAKIHEGGVRGVTRVPQGARTAIPAGRLLTSAAQRKIVAFRSGTNNPDAGPPA